MGFPCCSETVLPALASELHYARFSCWRVPEVWGKILDERWCGMVITSLSGSHGLEIFLSIWQTCICVFVGTCKCSVLHSVWYSFVYSFIHSSYLTYTRNTAKVPWYGMPDYLWAAWHTHTHPVPYSFTPRDNSTFPIHLPGCFWETAQTVTWALGTVKLWGSNKAIIYIYI